MEKLRSLIIPITLALLGIGGAIYATRWGVGLIADSKYYLGAAQSLLNGQGLVLPTPTGESVPMTNWPPLFSALLAGLGLLGIDLQVGARWLNTGLFGASILMTTLAIRHVTGGSTRLALLGGFLMATSVDLLYVHTLAGTEPLFIFFGLLGLVLVGAHLERPRPRFLFGAAAAIGLAFLSRYPGAVLVGTGALAVLFLGRRDRQARVKDATVLIVISSLPMLLWMLRSWLSAHQSIGSFRVLVFHPPTWEQVKLGFHTLWGWVSPTDGLARLIGHAPGIRAVLILTAATAAMIAIPLWWTRRTRFERETAAEPLLPSPLLSLLLVFIALYLGFVLVSISLLDHTIPLDRRLLSPIFPAALILVIGTARRFLGAYQGSQLARWAVTLGCFLPATVYADAATRWVIQGHENGLGYAGRYWRESDILRMVAALPAGMRIYTNGADVVTLVTGRLANELPPKVFPNTDRRNPSYGSDVSAMGEQLKHGAVLIYLNRITWRWYYPSEAELKERLPLRLRETAPDGVIYDIAP
jgi:dolichyl-phosphate-mannose-protein mannosyltransferase